MIAPDHARVTYDAFADHYDFFTADHDYDDWTATVERLATAHGLRGQRLLDVACGTGKSLLPFARRGYDVTACDVSAEMIRRAAAKAPPGVALEVCDMRELPVLGAFDLVTCLDDAFNYLLTADEVVATLQGLRRNLAPGGVLVFDVNSVRSYRTFFASLQVRASEALVVVADGHAPRHFRSGEVARSTLEVLRRRADGTWARRRSAHHQRHHPRAELEHAIDLAGLRLQAVYGMRLDGTVTREFAEGRSSKALYIARHRAPGAERR